MSLQPALRLWCSLPKHYPNVIPEVFASSTGLSRCDQKQLNEDLSEFVRNLDPEDICVTAIIMWLQDNGVKYFCSPSSSQTDSTCNSSKMLSTDPTHMTLSRLWIYSHHIYRKELLKKIPEVAKELDLTGFVLPGKPGIICVEGQKKQCDEYWQRLRYPNWKHISCKHREDKTVVVSQLQSDFKEQISNFRLFTNFEELSFEAHGDYGLRNDYHMDLGQFRKFLMQHKCDYMFSIFFGLESSGSNKK